MTSTIPSNTPYDPFAPDAVCGPAAADPDPMAGWLRSPAYGEPDRLVCSNDPFEDPPPVPDGYERIPGDDRGIRPVSTSQPVNDVSDAPEVDAPALSEPPRQEAKADLPLRSDPPARTAESPKQKPTNNGVPKTGVETRKPVDQNDYTMCAVNSKQLGGNALTVVLIASAEFGLTAFKRDRRFCMVERELTAQYIADKMLKSRPVAIAALGEAVKLGFLERTDNGRGGRGNTNKAKYRPVLPAYMPPPDRQV